MEQEKIPIFRYFGVGENPIISTCAYVCLAICLYVTDLLLARLCIPLSMAQKFDVNTYINDSKNNTFF